MKNHNNGGFAAEGLTAAALLAAAAASYKNSKKSNSIDSTVNSIGTKFSPFKGGMGLEMNGGRRTRKQKGRKTRGGEGEEDMDQLAESSMMAGNEYSQDQQEYQQEQQGGKRKGKGKKKGGFLKEFFAADNFSLPNMSMGGKENFVSPGEYNKAIPNPLSDAQRTELLKDPSIYQLIKDIAIGPPQNTQLQLAIPAMTSPAAQQGFASYDWNTPQAVAARAQAAELAKQQSENIVRNGPTVAFDTSGQRINAYNAVNNQQTAITGLKNWLNEVKSVELNTKLPIYQSDLNNLDKMAFEAGAANYLQGYPNATTMPWHSAVLQLNDRALGSLGTAGAVSPAWAYAPTLPNGGLQPLTNIGAKYVPGAIGPPVQLYDDSIGYYMSQSRAPGGYVDSAGAPVPAANISGNFTTLSGPGTATYAQTGNISPSGGMDIPNNVLSKFVTGSQSIDAANQRAIANAAAAEVAKNNAAASASYNWNLKMNDPNTTNAMKAAMIANSDRAAASTMWNQNLQAQAATNAQNAAASATWNNRLQYCNVNPSDPTCAPASAGLAGSAESFDNSSGPVPANSFSGGGRRRKATKGGADKLLAGALQLNELLSEISNKLENQQKGGRRTKSKAKGGNGQNVLENATNAITGGNIVGGKKKKNTR
jgi:hypothetical protein